MQHFPLRGVALPVTHALDRLRLFRWFLLLTLLWPGRSASGAPLPIALHPSGADPTLPGWHEHSIQHGGLTRWFLTYVPTSLAAGAPLVVQLHGGTGSMRTLFGSTAGASRQWPFVAEREGFLLVVPNGINPDSGDTAGDQQNWNDLRAPGSDRESTEDDVGFINRLIDWGIATHQSNSLRVYMTGSSNGGGMTYRMVMEHGGRLAAVTCGSANLPTPNLKFREPDRPVPILVLSGVEDPLMTYDGNPGVFTSALETVEWWRQRNGALPAEGPDEWLADGDPGDGCRVVRRTHPAAPGGAPVVFYRIEGGGHVGPSILHASPSSPAVVRLLGTQCRDIEFAEVAWAFMRQHQAPFAPRIAHFTARPTANPDRQMAISVGFRQSYPAGTVRLMMSLSATPSGPWTQIGVLPLDDLGHAGWEDLILPDPGPSRFFRAECVASTPLGD